MAETVLCTTRALPCCYPCRTQEYDTSCCHSSSQANGLIENTKQGPMKIHRRHGNTPLRLPTSWCDGNEKSYSLVVMPECSPQSQCIAVFRGVWNGIWLMPLRQTLPAIRTIICILLRRYLVPYVVQGPTLLAREGAAAAL